MSRNYKENTWLFNAVCLLLSLAMGISTFLPTILLFVIFRVTQIKIKYVLIPCTLFLICYLIFDITSIGAFFQTNFLLFTGIIRILQNKPIGYYHITFDFIILSINVSFLFACLLVHSIRKQDKLAKAGIKTLESTVFKEEAHTLLWSSIFVTFVTKKYVGLSLG